MGRERSWNGCAKQSEGQASSKAGSNEYVAPVSQSSNEQQQLIGALLSCYIMASPLASRIWRPGCTLYWPLTAQDRCPQDSIGPSTATQQRANDTASSAQPAHEQPQPCDATRTSSNLAVAETAAVIVAAILRRPHTTTTPARHPRSLTFLHRPARVLPHSAQLDPPLTSSVPSSFLLVLACSSMGFSTSKLYNDRVYKFVTLFFLVLPLTFLIVAASLHNLYSFNAADFDIPDDTLTGSAHVGAFYACVDLDGVMEEYQGFSNVAFSIHHCLRIRSDCTAHFYYDTSVGPGELDTGLGPDWNCSQYNAFRAFLILAILFVGFALLTASLSLLYLPQSRLLLWLTVGFNSFAVVSSIISWGLVADHWKTINDSNGGDWFKRGPAFGLVVTAFVLMVVALILYVLVWRIESVGYSKSDGRREERRSTQQTDEYDGADKNSTTADAA